MASEDLTVSLDTSRFNAPDFDVNEVLWRYPSYLSLLSTTPHIDDSMDAIVVPAARPVENIKDAAELAKITGTMLIALCSHDSDSDQMAGLLDDLSVSRWLAIDVPKDYVVPSVELVSAAEIPQHTRRASPSNLADKRNAGLVLGRMLGMHKILFADDDVSIDSRALRGASIMLNGRKIAGLRCDGFPDKAVVDHAEAAVVRHHRSIYRIPYPKAGHISGNSVAINVQITDIFFPPQIYNEDLLAFHPFYADQSAALVDDGKYFQDTFDPFADPDRARTEEFGEIIAHGLYQHLLQRSSAELTDKQYWDEVIVHRGKLAEYLLVGLDAPQKRENFGYMTRLPIFEQETKEKIRNSLLAAVAINSLITSTECIDYYQAWRTDQASWQSYLSDLPDPGTTTAQHAIEYLGFDSYKTNRATS